MANTVSAISVQDVPVVLATSTVSDVQALLTQNINHFKTINYIYVISTDHTLLGVVSIKELFRQKPDILVTQVMRKVVVNLRITDSPAQAVYVALKHNPKEVPILTADRKFYGVVPHDEILALTYKETRRELLSFAGFKHDSVVSDDIMQLSLIKSLVHRVPWLILGLLGGLLTAKHIESYSLLIQKNLILASFVPLVVYMGDAVGTQVEAFIIRDLTLTPDMKFLKYLLRQFQIVFSTGLVISTLLFGVSYFIYSDYYLALVLAVAMQCAVVASLFTGLLVPFFFSKVRMDPANVSGPVGTIIQDTITVILYFSVASYFIG